MPGYSLPLGPKHMIAMGHPRRTPGVTIHNPRQAAQRVGCCLTTNRSYLSSPRTPFVVRSRGGPIRGPIVRSTLCRVPDQNTRATAAEKNTWHFHQIPRCVGEAVGFKRPRQRRCAGCWESSARICQYNVNTHYFLPERKNNSR